MKLITLLLLASMAMGQDSTKTMNWGNVYPIGLVWNINGAYKELLRKDSSGVVAISDDEMKDYIHALVVLYDEYSKECWNDSTAVYEGHCYINTNPDRRYRFSMDVGNYYLTDKEVKKHGLKLVERFSYTHREPTFPGFIKYLRRKGL